ncbi:MAG: hypothetical protein V3V84_00595 [Candidatus Bathyarchaeia archaeon]
MPKTPEKSEKDSREFAKHRHPDGKFKAGAPSLNPKGKPKGRFSSRTWLEHELKNELPKLLTAAMEHIEDGNDKVLIFILGKILPAKPILERENASQLTENAQQNLLNILSDYAENKLSTEEATGQLTLVQKQVEIQQSDFVNLQNMVEKQNKKMEEMMESMNAK